MLQQPFFSMKRLFLVLILIICFFQIPKLKAQDACGTESTDFWVAFMPNSQSFFEVKLTLHISSRFDTNGSVFIGGVLLQNFTVNANSVLEIPIDIVNTPNTSGLIETKGIQVTSDNIITLYAENAQRGSSDASLIFPTSTLGKTYYPMCYNTLISEFVIVATQDNTQVTITPTVNTDDGQIANVPLNIVLNKAETYLLQASNHLDLTGSKIVSDKAIAVFSGNARALVPSGSYAADHLYEQIPPLSSWGKIFVTSPLANRAYDVFRILASKDNTNIRRNGVFFCKP